MSPWTDDGRPTPNGWAAIGAAIVICGAVTYFALVPGARGSDARPATGRAAVAHPTPTGTPPAAEPWYRVGLPVDGDLVSVGARTDGHVRVTAAPDGHVRIRLSGFSTDMTEADLRVQLTQGDVIRSRDRWVWVPDGDPVEVGSIRHGSSTADIVLRTPQILPTEVHSVVVLDWNTTTILGAAELLPSHDAG